MITFTICVALCIYLFFFQKKFEKENSIEAKVSIIIPARNEEKNIARLLTSLQNQKGIVEIIVVNDGSTDNTKKVALSHGVQVIDTPPLPMGWRGKSWACFCGAKVAKGEVLLFLDADTWVMKNGIHTLISNFEKNSNVGVMTVQPYHNMPSFQETFSLFFHLITLASINKGTYGGYGQCLLCRKSVYVQYGGHAIIKGEIVENLAFVRHLIQQGEHAVSYCGKDVIMMRMYSNHLGEIVKGWSKSFSKGAMMVPFHRLVIIILWLSCLYSFLFSFLSEPHIFGIIGVIILAIFFYLIGRKIGTITWIHALFWPLHAIFFLLVFVYSLFATYLLKNTTWKGRHLSK